MDYRLPRCLSRPAGRYRFDEFVGHHVFWRGHRHVLGRVTQWPKSALHGCLELGWLAPTVRSRLHLVCRYESEEMSSWGFRGNIIYSINDHIGYCTCINQHVKVTGIQS